MLKINCKNPLTEIFQKEYAIFMLLSSEFKEAECNSRLVENLKLYYADLVRVNENGNPSYEKQYKLEEECEKLIRNHIIGKIQMPALNTRKVKISITTNNDGTHSFTFRSGVYYFTYRFLGEAIEGEQDKYRVVLKVTETQGPVYDFMKEGNEAANNMRKGA